LNIIGKTLYSWKHTGVVQAYKNGVDIKAIQLQCRHYSIEQTDVYLKSLGFVENTPFLNGIPEI
jgi:integrase